MAEIVVDRLTKEFDNGFVAIDDVSLTVADGEFLVLVGPSGCGKSTLLRMIAGLEEVTAGTVYIGGRDVTELAPRHRDIAMVFQNYALYPHMDVRRNLAYGLKVRKTSKDEIDRRVEEVAHLLGLEKLLDRKPAALSGGQRQRVAMGRAIVREPAAFLMDEPLSNLDAKLRVTMRSELSRLHERLGVTTIYVTHDQVEAMTLGQRVAVLRDGVIQQVDRPQALYARPDNLFVAAFIGSPAMNLVEATVADGHASFAGWDLPLDPARRPSRDGRVILGIRPETFEDAALADPGASRGRRRRRRDGGARLRLARDLPDRRAPGRGRGAARRGRPRGGRADRRRPVAVQRARLVEERRRAGAASAPRRRSGGALLLRPGHGREPDVGRSGQGDGGGRSIGA